MENRMQKQYVGQCKTPTITTVHHTSRSIPPTPHIHPSFSPSQQQCFYILWDENTSEKGKFEQRKQNRKNEKKPKKVKGRIVGFGKEGRKK